MFWKKETDRSLKVEFEESARSAHRICPLEEDDLALLIDSRPCRIEDISAGGAQFQAPPGIRPGEVREFEFRLPGWADPIRGRIKILAVERGSARGSFEGLEEEAQDAIHLYVLKVQKRRLRDKAKAPREEEEA